MSKYADLPGADTVRDHVEKCDRCLPFDLCDEGLELFQQARDARDAALAGTRPDAHPPNIAQLCDEDRATLKRIEEKLDRVLANTKQREWHGGPK